MLSPSPPLRTVTYLLKSGLYCNAGRPSRRKMKPAKELLLAPIRFYKRRISPSPRLPAAWPSCSGYALKALQRHGALKGLLLRFGASFAAIPFVRGYDPVPPVGKWTPELHFLLFSPWRAGKTEPSPKARHWRNRA